MVVIEEKNWDDVWNQKPAGKLTVKVYIYREIDGRWRIEYKAYAKDGFTDDVFLLTEEGWRVRKAENGIYEMGNTTDSVSEVTDSFEKAKKIAKTVIEMIAEEREKVRNAPGQDVSLAYVI